MSLYAQMSADEAYERDQQSQRDRDEYDPLADPADRWDD